MQNSVKQRPIIIFIVLLLPMLVFLSGQSYAPKVYSGSIQETTIPEATFAATSTPDGDRLLEPTLPAEANQADLGAQDYWLNCMPCHGDFGQGLTDDFRQLYPEEDRGCWNSGCHSEKNPNVDGFSIPTVIPPVIGPGLLDKYGSASGLFSYVHLSMPRWDPGSLEDDVYWNLVAFLLRENNYEIPDENLGPENGELVLIGDQSQKLQSTSTAAIVQATQQANAVVVNVHSAPQNSAENILLIGAILGLGGLIIILFIRRMKEKQEQD